MKRIRQFPGSLIVIIIITLTVLLPLIPGAGSAQTLPEERGIQEPEPEYLNGWEHSFVFPVPPDFVHVRDKSMPLPEILRELSAPGGYVSPDDLITTGPFPLTLNSRVQSYIDYYSGPARRDFARWIRRGGLYRPMIMSKLREHGMPPELYYLCMIESGFNPRARSHAGAKGLWQFIRSTGRKFGLNNNYWMDERYDPEKSTDAALTFLAYLYDMFGDWYLAAASYNAGEGRVYYGKRATGCDDYWCLCDRKVIRLETRGYLPKIIAANIISNHPERYGFENVEPLPPLRYSKVKVDDALDLGTAAKCAGVSKRDIEELNPELNQFCTPPGMRGYELKVPAGTARRFRAAYNNLTPGEKRPFKVHKVARGESLRKVAAGYNTSYKMIAAMNGMASEDFLLEGQDLIVPVPKHARYNPTKRPPPVYRPGTGNVPRDGDKLTYVVEPGDSLWDIANYFNVSVADLKKWNNIKDPASIQYNDVIVVYTDEDKAPRRSGTPKISGRTKTFEYTVRPGDRCFFIAQHYGIHSMNIVEQNGLDKNCTIRPGQLLTLTVPEKATATMPPTSDGYENGASGGSASSSTYCAPLDVTKKPVSGPAGSKKIVYRVEKGDSLWEIARDHDVHVSEILAWNGLAEGVVINPGHELAVYVDKNSRKSSSVRPKSEARNTGSVLGPPVPDEIAACGCRNGKQVIYIVDQGDNLWMVAREHDTHMKDIKACNDMDTDLLRPGQSITICAGPAYDGPVTTASTPVPEKKKPAGKTGRKVVYEVGQGDSLWVIAREHDTHVAEVKSWNDLDSDYVKPGQELVIYPGPAYKGEASKPASSASGKSASSAGNNTSRKITYTVDPGDSLWMIARKHDTHVADVKRWNDLDSEYVKPGQKLTIYPGPAYFSPESAMGGPDESPDSITSTKGRKKVNYTVRQGDSLWEIAREHDVHVVDVKAWNNLSTDYVRPGQNLVIYVE